LSLQNITNLTSKNGYIVTKIWTLAISGGSKTLSQWKQVKWFICTLSLYTGLL